LREIVDQLVIVVSAVRHPAAFAMTARIGCDAMPALRAERCCRVVPSMPGLTEAVCKHECGRGAIAEMLECER